MHGALSAPSFACRFSGGRLEGAAGSMPLLVSQARTNRIVLNPNEKETIMVQDLATLSSGVVVNVGNVFQSIISAVNNVLQGVIGLI